MSKFIKAFVMAAVVSAAGVAATSPAAAADNQWFHQEKGDNQGNGR
ncbi:hypothetical protein [Rhizobium halophilum]|jgi:hypothetical protein|nr:hypothetical protein [Rhizobium halophilum]MCF6370669.1 hypothetical protein [Rhizobium halophilum]HEV7437435.1 hypothetical protein [Pseudorhizobium sp.]